jgi:TPP-dependent pyruvate/acetoin dehydrogenase alpha subunit
MMERLRDIYRDIQCRFEKGEFKGTLHLGRGQEAIDKGVIDACPDGFFVGNHRSMGQYLQFEDSEVLYKKIRDHENQHLYVPDKFISTGIQGAMCSLAVGVAMSYEKKGSDRNVVCFIGDGTLGQGSFYEALGMASVFNPNVTFILIDNLYSMSKTKLSVIPEFLANAYGLRYAECFASNNYSVVKGIMESWFMGTGAGIVYMRGVRLCGHSCSDTQRYRPGRELTEDFIQKNDFTDGTGGI